MVPDAGAARVGRGTIACRRRHGEGWPAREHAGVGSSGRGVRVIAGEAGGRRLVSPGGDVRPTTDRVKESVFSALGPDRIVGARVLDLFAGTGALAIEALSRGAAEAVLVDRSPGAVRAIATNLTTTGLAGRARVRRGDVETVLRADRPEDGPFDLVFADPPYDLGEEVLDRLLAQLAARHWVAPGGTVVVERGRTSRPPVLPEGWGSTWERCYGDTLVWFAKTIEDGG